MPASLRNFIAFSFANFAYAFRRDGMANLEEVAHFQQIVKNYIVMSDELEKDR